MELSAFILLALAPLLLGVMQTNAPRKSGTGTSSPRECTERPTTNRTLRDRTKAEKPSPPPRRYILM
ncbi:MAG: hypothetical protein DI547_08535 [Sphingobium sp.]|jgi:hypothetical protein|nr:MAG: hypothetical protein DI547_08535 [Sphingobium sp.]